MDRLSQRLLVLTLPILGFALLARGIATRTTGPQTDGVRAVVSASADPRPSPPPATRASDKPTAAGARDPANMPRLPPADTPVSRASGGQPSSQVPKTERLDRLPQVERLEGVPDVERLESVPEVEWEANSHILSLYRSMIGSTGPTMFRIPPFHDAGLFSDGDGESENLAVQTTTGAPSVTWVATHSMSPEDSMARSPRELINPHLGPTHRAEPAEGPPAAGDPSSESVQRLPAPESSDSESQIEWPGELPRSPTVKRDSTWEAAALRAPLQAPRHTQPVEKTMQSGFDLARQGLFHASHAQFIEALHVLAQSLDERTSSEEHTAALRRGLQAYDEAADFQGRSDPPGLDTDLADIIGRHQTPVLRQARRDDWNLDECLQRYMAFAGRQLVQAVGGEPLAAHALFGLGRLQAHLQSGGSDSAHVGDHRAMMLYQTALLVDDRHHAAANELGVLLARRGQLEEAATTLRHSVRLSPQPTAWQNLAVVYGRLGQPELAQRARQEAGMAKGMNPGPIVAGP